MSNFRRRIMLAANNAQKSCYGQGFWDNDAEWSNNDAWKNE